MFLTCIGQPVVWVISDKEDVDTLEVVWMSIKKRCPDAVVNTLMTDDGKQVFIVLKHNVINVVAGLVIISQIQSDSARKPALSFSVIMTCVRIRLTKQKRKKPNLHLKHWNTMCVCVCEYKFSSRHPPGGPVAHLPIL